MPASLGDGDVHLWRARLTVDESELESAAALLSTDELARVRRFRRASDARRFAVARGVLRRLLGAYLDADPRELVFEYGAHGKPRVSPGAGDGVSFNVAHSGETALLAFVRGREVGVDLEAIRDPAPLGVARQFFAEEELRALFDLPEAEQAGAFYRCWTRKEAYLKATGTGLSAPLGTFAVSLEPGGSEAVAQNRFAPLDTRCWAFLEPTLGEAHAASVVVEGHAGDRYELTSREACPQAASAERGQGASCAQASSLRSR
jgi:4'-phosphopantetheinyl transferase